MKLKTTEPLLPESKNLLALCFVGLTTFVALLTLGFLINTFSLRSLSMRKTTFVQLQDGTAARIVEEDDLYRSDETIKKFVSNWVQLTFSWDGKIPGTNDPDSGIKVKGSSKILDFGQRGEVLREMKSRSTVVG